MNFEKTGIYATKEQLAAVNAAYQLEFNSPLMAVLPGGKVPTPKEDFKTMANRFAAEHGLGAGNFAIDPATRQFFRLTDMSTREPVG